MVQARGGSLLARGALAGAAAGLAAAVVSVVLVRPTIEASLRIEHARAVTAGAHHEPELFSRPVQVLGGAVTAIVAGVLFGVVFAVVLGRFGDHLPAATPFGRALLLAGIGFAVFAALPGVKYPANPPGVGDPNTITDRTWMYASLLLAGLLVALLGLRLQAALVAGGRSIPARVTTVTAAVLGAVLVVLLAWPDSPDRVPSDMPAGLLWDFRLRAMAQLATLWGVLGFTMGWLVDGLRARPEAAAAGRSRDAPVPTP